MVEVKQVMQEHPKLVSENQDLKRKNAKSVAKIYDLDRKLQKLQEVLASAAKDGLVVMPSLKPNPFATKRKASDLAKDLRQMENVRLATEPVQPLEAPKQPSRAKYSSTANRLAAACRSKAATKKRPSPQELVSTATSSSFGETTFSPFSSPTKPAAAARGPIARHSSSSSSSNHLHTNSHEHQTWRPLVAGLPARASSVAPLGINMQTKKRKKASSLFANLRLP